MIRRLKEDINLDLPDKKRTTLYVDADFKFRPQLDDLQKRTDEIDEKKKRLMVMKRDLSRENSM